MDRPSQTDPIWTIRGNQKDPIPVTRISGEVVWIDPSGPHEPDSPDLTPGEELRITEATLTGRSELRGAIETVFGGPAWPPPSALLEPFKRYAVKVFDANAAAYRGAPSKEGSDPSEVLNTIARSLLAGVFGSEWESSPGEQVIRTDWQHGVGGWQGKEVVVPAGNDPDPNCLYHVLIDDAVKYRYRFHAVLPEPLPGEPPGISLSNREWWQYIGLNERHNLAMAIKPYLEDRIAYWRFVCTPKASEKSTLAQPSAVAVSSVQKVANPTVLTSAEQAEIEETLALWRDGIAVDVTTLLSWAGWLQEASPPESMEYFEELSPDLRRRSFLNLEFDWDGSGTEILSHDQITDTLLKNLRRALKRYAQQAIELISSKWANKGIRPEAFSSRMESAGKAIQHDLVEMIEDGVSALAHGASTDGLQRALSEEVRTGIARRKDLYLRNAQLTGLCELPERDDVAAESRVAIIAEEDMTTRKLPPASAQKVRAKIDAAETLLTQGTKWLPTELQEGKRTKQEIEAILCQKSKEWAWDVFVTILREWAEIGIPPDEFEAIAKGQIESLSTHAEERVAAFVSAFELSSGEVLRCVREFLPCLIRVYREENRFRFHAVTARGEAASQSKLATPPADGPATRADAPEQSQEAGRTVDSVGRSGARTEATFPARASWLKDRLLERGWSNSDPAAHDGPDRKTVQKILRGEAVRNDVLQKLADALSQRHGKVNVLDIPQD